ncbi:MAG TPA: exonuclease SbcCD subunit D [Longimicrobium sp.]|nr:exonuclease SbcCD subunit D [Longimicrobium sp.]
MRIAHLADLHLGYRAYHRVNQRGMNVREADVAEAFRQAVARVIELRPDLVLVAGDVFHTVRPSNTAIADAFRQFSLMADRLPDVPIVVIAGNHDSPRSADTGNILNLFKEIGGVRVVCDDCSMLRLPELETTVRCEPHVALFTEDPPRREADPGARHNVLLLHGQLQGPRGAAKLSYISEYGGANIDESSIRWGEWDYIALGHHHSCQEIERNAWYAGGLERTSTNIWAEKEEKGFLVYDTDARQAEFHAVETRTMVDLPKVSARELGPAELDEAILRAVSKVQDGLRGKIVRLLVFDVPRGVVRELNHRRIRDWKAEAVHFHLDVRPPEVRRRVGSGAPVRRQTLREQVAGFLEKWEIQDRRVERPRLVELGTEYVDRTVDEG